MSIRILLADDHQLFRDGLRSLLERRKGYEVVAEASDGLGTVELAKKHKPDIILLDVSMPDINGIEAARMVLDEFPEIKIIILSMHSDRRYVIQALKSKVAGYLLKDSAIEEVLRVIDTVMAGKIYLSEQISDSVIREYINLTGNEEKSAYTLLSPREREVLQLLAEGKTTKEIASNLNLSIKTIETHRRQIMDKLNLRSIAELTKYAIREGLTQLDQ